MANIPHILICDDDALFQSTVKLAFKGEYRFSSAMNGDEALALFRKQSFSIVLLDIQMRTPTEGLGYIQRLKEIDPDISIIITSGVKEFEVVRDALRLGADDYILKGHTPGRAQDQGQLQDPDQNPSNNELAQAIAHCISRAVRQKNLVRCNERQSAEVLRLQHGQPLVGVSPQIEALRCQILRAKESFTNVLITGETGTGKEVVARLLRNGAEPFVTIDSSTIQSSMAESILFGHERGAFTGADKVQKGIFEEADGGVVYFDEIANMPLDIQCKLLRVLEEKEIKRLGSQRVIFLDFRVICATNQNLEALVEQGKFKEDLLQRLNVIPLTLTPLRERREDIPVLIDHLLFDLVRKSHRINREIHFDKVILKCLSEYHWPGNVRELSNLLLFLLSMSENDQITLTDLPSKIRQGTLEGKSPILGPSRGGNFHNEIFKFEKKILQDALLQSEGKVGRASSLLGIDRSHLYTKLKEHGLFEGRSTRLTSPHHELK